MPTSLAFERKENLSSAVLAHGCDTAREIADPFLEALDALDSGELSLGLDGGADLSFAAQALTAMVNSCPRSAGCEVSDCPLLGVKGAALVRAEFPESFTITQFGNRVSAEYNG